MHLAKLRPATRLLAIAIASAFIGACSSMPGMTMGSQNVTMVGANEVPPVTTSASGSGTVTINPDHTVSAKITIVGMNATAAHIHEAPAGSNGPVIVPFTKTADNVFEAPAGAKLTDAQYASYKAGNLYVNAHSAAHPGGEVRAQLKP
jgi:CHRD domain-containing protein